jgi:hypothetical protein
MSKKPYMYEHKEWLEIFQREDWNDPTVNPDDLAEYSEFNKPYKLDDDEDNYPLWELTWPDPEWIVPPPLVFPDPVPGPCSQEDLCTSAGIVGPGSIKCGMCYPYTHAQVVLGCAVNIFGALGEWSFEASGDGCTVRKSLVFATICCDDTAQPQVLELCYHGALGCSACINIVVTQCDECCEEFTLDGDETVNDNATWTGTITPPCPNATCEVTSNSGCVGFTCGVNELGSEVSVSVPDDACGGFTVTVTDQSVSGECTESSDSFSVRINNTGGLQPEATWTQVSSCSLGAGETCGVGGASCNNGVGINGTCYTTSEGAPYKYVHNRECCHTNQPGLGCGTDCSFENCPTQKCTCPPCSACTGLCNATCSCFGTGAHWTSVVKSEWKCVC